MNREKLIHQLFIGKVAEELGLKKTAELLKASREAINKAFEQIESNQAKKPS